MSKDYSNTRALAMGDVSNLDLANLCLHQTATSTDLASVLRAAHDRILHLDQALTAARAEFVVGELSSTAEPTVNDLLRSVMPRGDLSVIEDNAVEETVSQNTVEPREGETSAFIQDMPNPSEEDLNDPMFEAIWQRIKDWDINVPSYYNGYCGANGSHVMLILNALRDMQPTNTIMHVTILTQPKLKREDVLQAALNRGFKKRPQPGGEQDLNEYVYEFAEDIRLLSRPDHHVVDIEALPRFTVYEDNGSVVIKETVDGTYLTFDNVQDEVAQGKIHMESNDEHEHSDRA